MPMPQCERVHLDAGVGVRVHARAPVDDAVRARVERDVADLGRERARQRARGSARSSRRAGSATRSAPAPGRCRARRATPTCASTTGCTASWETTGEPSVTTPATRSGRRAPSAFAKTPPRLWPMITTRSPGALGQALEPLLQPRAGDLRAGDVRADAGALRAVAGGAQPLGHRAERAVAGEEARDQQHAAPVARRAPRRRGRRPSAAGPPTRARSGSRARAGGRCGCGSDTIASGCTRSTGCQPPTFDERSDESRRYAPARA